MGGLHRSIRGLARQGGYNRVIAVPEVTALCSGVNPHHMSKSRLQFSLQGMLWFLLVGTIMLGVNLRSRITTGEILLSISLPRGESHMRDWVMIETGYPLRYQRFRQLLESGTGQAVIANGWPSSDVVPVVTHVHWLVVNAIGSTTLALFAGWMLPRIVGRLRR